MKKEVLQSISPVEGGIDYNVSFPLFCRGEERDAFAISAGKKAVLSIKEQSRAAIYQVSASLADEFVKSSILQHQELQGSNINQITNTVVNLFIKLIGGYRHNDYDNDYDPKFFRTEFYQHWNAAQALFVENPATFLEELKVAISMSNRLRSGSSYSYAVRERSEELDSAYSKNLKSLSNPYLQGVINDGATQVFFESFPYKENLYIFDMFATLANNLYFEVVSPFGNRQIDTFDQFRFHNFKLLDYSKRNQLSHDQLTAAGQYAKVISNRIASQSTDPTSFKSFDFGAISALFNFKSDNIDYLSDAFAKLLSSNYSVSYRGIYSGALFLQVDDFTTTNGNREDVVNAGYIELIRLFCGGEDFDNSFILIDLNKVAEASDQLYTHSWLHSLAREFAIINIHTHQAFLVSIGEHRFNGQNLWRSGNRSNLGRLSSQDLITDSLTIDNELLRDLDDYRSERFNEDGNDYYNPELSKSSINFPFSTRVGRGITSIHAIEFSPCISGASLVHSPYSSLISESADDDKDAIQYDLNYASLTGSVGARSYELQKAKDQKQFMVGVIGDLLKSRKNLVVDVFNFNIARAVFRSDSDFADIATWNNEKLAIKELTDRYHVSLWLALYATDAEFDGVSTAFEALPAVYKSMVNYFRVAEGKTIDEMRKPHTVQNNFSYLVGRLMAISNELDLNHNGNIFISQSLRKYAFYDGNAEYTPNNFNAADSTFVVYPTLNMHLFVNLGDDVYTASDYNGLPIQNPGSSYNQTNPNTIPSLANLLLWQREVNETYCYRLSTEFVANDVRHNGTYDGYGDNKVKKSNDLIILDIDPLLDSFNTIISLPTLFLSVLKEKESKYYVPSNPLFTHALSLYGHARFGYITGKSNIAGKMQTEFNFPFHFSNIQDRNSMEVLTYLANCYGVINMDGATGQYLSNLQSFKFNTEGGRIVDTDPVFFRDLACAIHKDTGEIPCTSSMVQTLLAVNQKILDLDFNYYSGLPASKFSNESKLDIIEKAKPFIAAAFKRSTALFLYDNYK